MRPYCEPSILRSAARRRTKKNLSQATGAWQKACTVHNHGGKFSQNPAKTARRLGDEEPRRRSGEPEAGVCYVHTSGRVAREVLYAIASRGVPAAPRAATNQLGA